MSEEDDVARKRKEIRDKIDRLIEEYVRVSEMISGSELITNWVILVPSGGMDKDGDDSSYVHTIMRDGQVPAWQLMGMLQHEMTTTKAMVTAREWSSPDDD